MKTIQAYNLISTSKELCSFLGLSIFEREYPPMLTRDTAFLYNLPKVQNKKTDLKIQHTVETNVAFVRLKELVTADLKRAQPNLSATFILTTDASEIGLVLYFHREPMLVMNE